LIALDTNVIIRFLVGDDVKQARRARALVQRLGEEDERAYVSDVVLCEVVWVLTRSYGFDRRPIVQVLIQLLAARQLLFDSVEHLSRALEAYASGKGDFADYLIREHATRVGCDSVVTFDNKLLSEVGFAPP
jgi:predicted nucleic-acid-binding protein